MKILIFSTNLAIAKIICSAVADLKPTIVNDLKDSNLYKEFDLCIVNEEIPFRHLIQSRGIKDLGKVVVLTDYPEFTEDLKVRYPTVAFLQKFTGDQFSKQVKEIFIKNIV